MLCIGGETTSQREEADKMDALHQVGSSDMTNLSCLQLLWWVSTHAAVGSWVGCLTNSLDRQMERQTHAILSEHFGIMWICSNMAPTLLLTHDCLTYTHQCFNFNSYTSYTNSTIDLAFWRWIQQLHHCITVPSHGHSGTFGGKWCMPQLRKSLRISGEVQPVSSWGWLPAPARAVARGYGGRAAQDSKTSVIPPDKTSNGSNASQGSQYVRSKPFSQISLCQDRWFGKWGLLWGLLFVGVFLVL